eukprot:11750004-Alexandrium_andersonii.AAC.1
MDEDNLSLAPSMQPSFAHPAQSVLGGSMAPTTPPASAALAGCRSQPAQSPQSCQKGGGAQASPSPAKAAAAAVTPTPTHASP